MNTWKEMLFNHKKAKGFKRNQGCVVSGSLALVLRVSRGLAMSPLSVTRAHTAWQVATSSTLAVLQRLLITAFNIVTVAGLGWDLCLEGPRRVRAGESTIKTVVWICDLVLLMLIANIAIYMGPSRMESLVQVLKQLQQINLSLKTNLPSAKSETIRSFVIICLLIWSTVLQLADVYYLTQVAFKENKMCPIMGMNIAYNYANILEVMVALQWYYLTSGAHGATSALNHQLQQLRDAEVPESQAQAMIRHLALSYDRISEVMMQMSAGHGPILLVMIISNAFRLTLSPYYLLLSIYTEVDVVASSVLLQSNWIAFHIIKLLLIVEPSHWTQEQREHTEFVLSQLTVQLAPKSKSVSKELDQFAKQVVLNKAKFMPLGISMLSRPLIVTIICSASTYLIIMIQFQKICTQL